jgi:hypothetical protein
VVAVSHPGRARAATVAPTVPRLAECVDHAAQFEQHRSDRRPTLERGGRQSRSLRVRRTARKHRASNLTGTSCDLRHAESRGHGPQLSARLKRPRLRLRLPGEARRHDTADAFEAGEHNRQGKACRRRPKRLKSGEKGTRALPARCGATAGGASRRLVRTGRLSEGASRPVRAGAGLACVAVRKLRRAGRRRCRQSERGRLEREAGRAGSGGFGYGTARRTSAAGLSSRRPS